MMIDRLRAMSRRDLLKGGLTTGLMLVAAESLGQEVLKEISDLKPGEYTWHPDRQPTGPVAIVVSLPEQLVHVYRNGIRIAVSTVSTGKPGHETPTGVFVVLQKAKVHHSSTYNEASMPNTERLTWSGVALHAGGLPGYPSSHGCVHLPLDFSAKLFGITYLGTPVIISGNHADPWELTHPGMVLSGYAESEFSRVEAGLDGKKEPADWTEAETHPVVSVIASSADRKIEMVQDGDVVATGNLTIKGSGPLGSHVFVLQGADAGVQGMKWTAITHSIIAGAPPEGDALTRLTADTGFIEQMKQRMHPGMVMILTDAPLEPETKSGRDFVIMS
ncbi:L,D-transpeptidase [Mesorhizobium sp. VNQ89]|uniref:L,D-transpeptidase n=1 Tax=Mesorhizobium quangtriensis TaxID=3157709 RepID=UPI0032B7BBC2